MDNSPSEKRVNKRIFSPKIFKAVNILLTIFTIIFSILYFGKLVQNDSLSSISIQAWSLFAAYLFFLLAYGAASYHWLLSARLIETSQSFHHFLSFFASQPYKYLPSSLFTFSYRAKFSKDLGLSIKKSSLAQLAENITLLGSGIYVGMIFYLIHVDSLISIYIIGASFVSLALVIKYHDKLKIPIKKIARINILDLARNACIGICVWVLFGISFYFLHRSLGFSISLISAISAASLSYVLSILAFFSPGGIGVREYVLSLFSIANPVIIFWRILTFSVDMIFGFCAVIIIGKIKKLSANTYVAK